jgi:hypothetical protein
MRVFHVTAHNIQIQRISCFHVCYAQSVQLSTEECEEILVGDTVYRIVHAATQLGEIQLMEMTD